MPAGPPGPPGSAPRRAARAGARAARRRGGNTPRARSLPWRAARPPARPCAAARRSFGGADLARGGQLLRPGRQDEAVAQDAVDGAEGVLEPDLLALGDGARTVRDRLLGHADPPAAREVG